MGFLNYIRQDWDRNRNNTKGKVIAILFRTASYVSQSKVRKILFFPYLIFYRFFVEWILGIEIPWQTQINRGLKIYHGQSTVINKSVTIGENCTIRHCTTIGNSKEGGGCPVIGDNVEIGANVCILGQVTIGDYVVIGAGSVVVRSIPSRSVVVGNPARVIKVIDLP